MLAIGAGRLTGIGGRFFGAPSLGIGGPELDIFVAVVGAVESSGMDTVGEVSGAMGLVEVDGGSLEGSFESISIAFVDGKAVFAFAAFTAAINSFGVLYSLPFVVDSAVSFRVVARAMRGAGCATVACTLKVAGVA